MLFNFQSGYPPMQFFNMMREGMHTVRRTTRLDNFTSYYDVFTNLCDLFLNLFEWHNLPETCNERALETSMLFNGNCLFFQHKTNNAFLHAPFTYDAGTLNFYGEPTKYRINSPTYWGELYDENNAIPIFATRMQYPLWIALEMYSRRLADNMRSLDVVQQTMKRPFAISGSKDAEVTIKEIMHQAQSNELYMIRNKNNINADDFKLFNIPESSNNMYALWDNLNNLYTEVYKRLGIDCANKDKKERLVVDEANNQKQVSKSELNMMLDARLECVEKINKKWGLNIGVEIKHSEIINSISQGGDIDAKG